MPSWLLYHPPRHVLDTLVHRGSLGEVLEGLMDACQRSCPVGDRQISIPSGMTAKQLWDRRPHESSFTRDHKEFLDTCLSYAEAMVSEGIYGGRRLRRRDGQRLTGEQAKNRRPAISLF